MKRVKILALVAAVITALLLFVFLSTVIKFGGGDTVSVITAAQNIPADTAITEEMIVAEDIPTDMVLPGAITSTADLLGKSLKTQVYAGEQIISARVVVAGEAGSGTLAYSIEPGMRAVTIAVDATTGIAGMIKPGDKVDLIGEYDIDGDVKSDMIAQNVKILAVDNVLQQAGKTGDGTAPAYSTITMEVSPRGAMEVSLAFYSGTLRAILRSPLDDDSVNIKSFTLQKVLND